MSDVLMGKTEIDAVSQELVMASMTQQYLQEAAMFPDKIMTFSAPNGNDVIKIPRAGGFTVVDKLENTPVDAQTITWATDNLNLDKHRTVQVLLEKIASIQSMVNQELQIAERAGLDLAYDTDLKIVQEFYSTASNSAPDHTIAFSSGSTLSKGDLLEAKRLLDVQKVPQDGRFFAVDPTGYSELLNISDFVRVDAIPNPTGLRQAIVGRIFGFDVFMSTAVEADKHIAFHRSALAYGIQEMLTYDNDKDLANLAVRHSWDQIYGLKGLDLGKRHVIVGTATV